jgi:hypothetical protein
MKLIYLALIALLVLCFVYPYQAEEPEEEKLVVAEMKSESYVDNNNVTAFDLGRKCGKLEVQDSRISSVCDTMRESLK